MPNSIGLTTQPGLFDLPGVRMHHPGKVYYATDGVNIKIGYSTSPRRRGGELKLTMLYTFDGTRAEERREHDTWRKYRIKQEWFQADPALLSWLDRRVPRAGVVREVFRGLVFREAA